MAIVTYWESLLALDEKKGHETAYTEYQLRFSCATTDIKP